MEALIIQVGSKEMHVMLAPSGDVEITTGVGAARQSDKLIIPAKERCRIAHFLITGKAEAES